MLLINKISISLIFIYLRVQYHRTVLKNFLNIIVLTLFNFYVLSLSSSIKVEQVYFDFQNLGLPEPSNENTVFIFIGFCVSILTSFLIYFFKPFIEIYLLHYFRHSFYLLINLLSISTVYLTLRIYGYSRLLVLIYLFLSTVSLVISDKNYFIKRK